ncbi:unnamed protein product [Phytophthora fragariaefolia]|uniref:Unnamed protein product n=1 Tax=Phytophthora fragariaefolia TaxID=1490495 RepID=A0A9W6TMU9_9STRA|nr:unnamed protein product [Phytophthora fragariaefolia]
MTMWEDESITAVDTSATDPAEFECSANEIDLEDHAQELAFQPDLTDSASTVLDYDGSNVLAAVAELLFPTSSKGMQDYLGALNYYSRFIQNMAVYGAVLYQLKDADFADGGDLAAAKSAFAELKTKVANAPILRHFDSAKEVHIMLFANVWALSSTLLQPHDGLLHPVRFCGRVLRENDVNYHQLRWRCWHSHIY